MIIRYMWSFRRMCRLNYAMHIRRIDRNLMKLGLCITMETFKNLTSVSSVNVIWRHRVTATPIVLWRDMSTPDKLWSTGNALRTKPLFIRFDDMTRDKGIVDVENARIVVNRIALAISTKVLFGKDQNRSDLTEFKGGSHERMWPLCLSAKT